MKVLADTAAVLIAAAACGSIAAGAEGQEKVLSCSAGGVDFSCVLTDNDAVLITGAEAVSGELRIPDKLDGHKVSGVDERAFFGNERMTALTFTAPVTVGASAFAGCSALKRINGTENITALGKYAFTGCSALESVELPPVSVIPEGAFASCTSLKKVAFSSSNTTIEDEAFYGCRELSVIDIPDSITAIGENVFGVLYDLRSDTYSPDSRVLIKCGEGSAAVKYAKSLGIDSFDRSKDTVGDVNRDGYINAADASDVLMEYSLMSTGGKGTFSGYKQYTGDYDGNGRIDAADATEILQEYSRLSTQLVTTTVPVTTTAPTKAATTVRTTTTAKAAVKTTTTVQTTTAVRTTTIAKTTSAVSAVKSTVTTKTTSAPAPVTTRTVTTAGTTAAAVKTTVTTVKK